MDEHFQKAAPKENMPLILGLLDVRSSDSHEVSSRFTIVLYIFHLLFEVWNGSLLGYEGVAILPYCQALLRFVPHIQQLDMESNGKGVQMVPGLDISFGSGF